MVLTFFRSNLQRAKSIKNITLPISSLIQVKREVNTFAYYVSLLYKYFVEIYLN